MEARRYEKLGEEKVQVCSINDDNEESSLFFEHPAPPPETKFGRLTSRCVKYSIPTRPELNENTPMEYNYYPPPKGMIITSSVMMMFSMLDMGRNEYFAKNMCFIPHRKEQAWRFFTYIFVHNNFLQLLVNLSAQLSLGMGMEIVHSTKTTLIIFYTGAFYGSLISGSLDQSSIPLTGASSGVYSLIFSHIPYIIIYRDKIPTGSWYKQTSTFLLIVALDFGAALYFRYGIPEVEAQSCSGHYGGILTGLCFGIFQLTNRQDEPRDIFVKYSLLVVYTSVFLVLFFVRQ